MTDETFSIQRPVKAKEFYDDDMGTALANCQETASPLFMPDLIVARTNAQKGSRIWQVWYTTPSIRATGTTAGGANVVVYAHCPNYLSNPRNIAKAKEAGLVNGAGRIPQKEFQKLVDSDEKTDQAGNRLVYVVDYDILRKASSGVISVDDALAHPQTIPFCGGKAQAEGYLPKHMENYGKRIGNWHSDDLNADSPLGRLLYVGGSGSDGLSGNDSLDGSSRFGGVPKSAVGTQRKISEPTSTQVIKITRDYVAPRNRAELEARVKGLFQ